MKFGKHLEGRQLELPEYNGHFINYKALKKLIKQLSVPAVSSYTNSNDYMTLDETDESIRYQSLQENRASFFFKLERELEKVNEFYIEKEADLRMKLDLLNSRYYEYKSKGKLTSKSSIAYRTIRDGIKKFERDLAQLEQFVDLNRTGFSKVLKKWDKRSHSHAKDFYLATVVSVQPIFTRNEVSKCNDAVSTMLIELDELSDNEEAGGANFYGSAGQVSRTISRNSDHSHSMTNILAPKPETRTSISSDNSTLLVNFSQGSSAGANHYSTSSSTAGLFDIELEIESWYMEVLSISKLKDVEPRKAHIKTFVETKVQSFVESHLSSTRIDKNLVIRDSITKIFNLLLASSIDDESLEVFWKYGSDHIDLTYSDSDDDLVFARHNMFHEAALCPHQPRTFVLLTALYQYQNSIIPRETFRKLLNAQDIHGKMPLHYACELGKTFFVSLLLSVKLIDNVDLLDNASKTPLVLSIINNHIETTKVLISKGDVNLSPSLSEGEKPQFHPLNVACSYKNYEAAKIILEEGDVNLSKLRDSQGLCPLHIVAKRGGGSELIKLLVSYGADPNEIDGFNKWPPIFYAIQEGHATTVQVLLELGANVTLTDQKNLSQVFYALWEGHLSVLNVLLGHVVNANRKTKFPEGPLAGSLKPSDPSELFSDDQLSLNDSLKDIPDFTLPPPIIPLRKYGHNFLERKVFVKLSFKPEKESITLNKDDETTLSSPGRITLTSSVSHIIPRNIILPIQEDDEKDIVFQIDSLDNFDIDIEIYPSFGTRLIAKTYALSNVFHEAYESTCNNKHITLPLFDTRLRNVGKFDLDFEVIFPYGGNPLEVTKYETYWKSTSGGGANNNTALSNSLPSIVTTSSLGGEYCSVGVIQLNDGTLIASPSLICNAGDVPLLFNDISVNQLNSMLKNQLTDIPANIASKQVLKDLLRSRYMLFEDLLSRIDPRIQLNIKVSFPTESEIQSIPVKVSPRYNLNCFVETVLSTTFDHVRKLRQVGSTRAIVFSSTNPRVCSILNWKQPNFPVLFDVNVVAENAAGDFIKITSNDLASMALDQSKIIYGNAGTMSIKEAVTFANNNNLLGIILPINLLNITLQLVDQVLAHGLFLIGSTKGTVTEHEKHELDVNGIQYNQELIIHESSETAKNQAEFI
ncbi:unnamed protein product [Kluyveromyces dobzhanskii CBS 2104]|uniref:WGS project CCBQ000000000 data, contig 00046 n=1 Tax=Kluyveromyces dobzhanskii CBS 2104 TaxID=1427455 RepID=A0A0A8L9E8_9SACH|nr:unnamed protein product [Kluyveromyces dobzhanskii CBS 2104]